MATDKPLTLTEAENINYRTLNFINARAAKIEASIFGLSNDQEQIEDELKDIKGELRHIKELLKGDNPN